MLNFCERVGILALVLWAGCGTVDPGPDVATPPPCNAPTPYFVSDVWPRYFDRYSCGKSDCHDQSTGHGYFRLRPVNQVPAPQPTDPLAAWPDAWRFNYRSVTQNVSCANPIGSAVLMVPQQRTHPGGLVVTGADVATATELFRMWLR